MKYLILSLMILICAFGLGHADNTTVGGINLENIDGARWKLHVSAGGMQLNSTTMTYADCVRNGKAMKKNIQSDKNVTFTCKPIKDSYDHR